LLVGHFEKLRYLERQQAGTPSDYTNLGYQQNNMGIEGAYSRQQMTACHIVMHIPTPTQPSTFYLMLMFINQTAVILIILPS
jgi:hypothetical protein